jgi:hypothetical protein
MGKGTIRRLAFTGGMGEKALVPFLIGLDIVIRFALALSK